MPRERLQNKYDSGLAAHVGSDRRRRLFIWALHECLAQHEYAGKMIRVAYYRSSKHSHMDFVIRERNMETGVLLTERENIDTYTLRTAEAFLRRLPGSRVLILAPVPRPFKPMNSVSVMPWWWMG